MSRRSQPPFQLGGAWCIRCRDNEHAAAEGARLVFDALIDAGEKDTALALSGGRIAPLLYAELVRQSASRSCRLAGTDIFWADERCVPPDHPESNYRLARLALIEPLALSANQIHRLPGEEPPETAAAMARADWDSWSARRNAQPPFLDCVILGVGEDGHVASLFPENLAVDLNRPESFRYVTGSKPPPDRLTMGYPLLWQARRLVILAVGPGKTEVVEASLRGTRDTPLARVVERCQPSAAVVVTTESPV